MEKLDRYDRAILKTLQENGRASNVELSDRANLSAPQCYRRVRRLESDGINRAQYKHARSLEKAIRQFPEIIECYTISGDFDYLLKVVATDLKSLSSFLTDRLMQVPGVSGVRSMVCLEEIKPASPLPISQAR